MPNFHDLSQSMAEIKLLPVFGKRTAATLEFYLRFRLRPIHSHWHVILHLPAKFGSNRTIVSGVMTS